MEEGCCGCSVQFRTGENTSPWLRSADIHQLIGFLLDMSPLHKLLIAGAKVGDVELPPWARDAADFAAKLAEALESPQVSGQLHAWIDLIFGCSSQGAGAEKADNVFHYLTYDGM